MSLSKYFKDSSSFKPEKIVKSQSPEPTGWKSKATPPSAPFEPGSISAPQTQNELTTGNQTAVDKTTESSPTPESTPPSVVVPDEQPVSDVTPDTTVDLSNYLSLEEAEEKALESYQQGIEEGLAKAAEDFGSAAKALTAICEQLDTVRETLISNSSEELEQFALLIAEKIIRLSLRQQDQTIVATIREALSRAVKSDEFTLIIHPDDSRVIAEKSADLVAGVSGLSNIVITTDPTIERGGAKIESENCIIDATVASQFEAIRDEINKAKK